MAAPHDAYRAVSRHALADDETDVLPPPGPHALSSLTSTENSLLARSSEGRDALFWTTPDDCEVHMDELLRQSKSGDDYTPDGDCSRFCGPDKRRKCKAAREILVLLGDYRAVAHTIGNIPQIERGKALFRKVGEDKYECPFCKQKDKFQPSVTSRHIRIHLCRHHQPYKCRYPSCSYACTRNTAISNHHKIHMPGVRICSVEHCHRQFTGPMSLRHHLQEAHNVAYPPAATTTGFVDTYRSVETISKRKRGGTDERSGMKRGRKKACAKSHNPAATVPPSNPVLVSPLPPLAQYSTGTPEWSLPPPPVSPSTSTSTHVPPSCRTARDIPGCPYAEVSGEHNSEEHKFSHPIPSSSLSKSCPNEPGAVSEFSAESGVTWNWSKLKASNTEYNGDLVWCPSRPIHPAPAYWGYWFPFYPQA